MKDIKIGIYVCWCGTNISKMVNVEQVVKEVQEMEGVVIARDYKYMCSDPGQDLIINDIHEHKLTRVVVAACSPRIHELTFRKAIEFAGLNPYLFQMVNIREQVSWVHDDPERATRKAIDLVKGAIKRVKLHEPLNKRRVEVNPATLIIGGGIAGLSAAREIAESGYQVYLVEREKSLGGIMAKISHTFPTIDSAGQLLNPLLAEVMKHPRIKIFLSAEVKEIHGYIGNFRAQVGCQQSVEEILFGNILIATGLKPFNPGSIEHYGYARIPNVITSLEFEEMLSQGQIRLKNRKLPSSIAIIHCVGSRNHDYHAYCSRTCCMTALKYANEIKDMLPHTQVSQIYADMRAMGKGCEELYTNTSKRDVLFLMFDQQQNLPFIRKADPKERSGLLIEMKELLSGEQIEVPADMVILMVGMEAHESAKSLGQLAGISVCSNKFYIEKHPKLDPVATTTDGVFIVGNCQAPKDIPDSIAQAKAGAARVIGLINQGSVEVEVTTSHVNEEICCGCQTCIRVCPYSAVEFLTDKNVSHVNEVLCKGCGTCTTACPTGAIQSYHFTEEQILSQIEGIMSQLIEV